jgi:hypothetical protein
VAGGVTGIQAIWADRTEEERSPAEGEKTELDAFEIEAKAKAGNNAAISIYNNSAAIAANTAEGLARASGLTLESGDTAVVLHGGITKFDQYDKRVEQILKKAGSEAPVIYTKDFSDNACLEGAALAALSA